MYLYDKYVWSIFQYCSNAFMPIKKYIYIYLYCSIKRYFKKQKKNIKVSFHWKGYQKNEIKIPYYEVRVAPNMQKKTIKVFPNLCLWNDVTKHQSINRHSCCLLSPEFFHMDKSSFGNQPTKHKKLDWN